VAQDSHLDAAEAARATFEALYPELGIKLTAADFEPAIAAWTRAPGRPRLHEPSRNTKWFELNRLAVRVGVPSVDEATIGRDARRYGWIP
jgi:hypothetical protein